jgi:hypothetical protein
MDDSSWSRKLVNWKMTGSSCSGCGHQRRTRVRGGDNRGSCSCLRTSTCRALLGARWTVIRNRTCLYVFDCAATLSKVSTRSRWCCRRLLSCIFRRECRRVERSWSKVARSESTFPKLFAVVVALLNPIKQGAAGGHKVLDRLSLL